MLKVKVFVKEAKMESVSWGFHCQIKSYKKVKQLRSKHVLTKYEQWRSNWRNLQTSLLLSYRPEGKKA